MPSGGVQGRCSHSQVSNVYISLTRSRVCTYATSVDSVYINPDGAHMTVPSSNHLNGNQMSTVTFEKDGAVGVVSLSKPPHNLIDEALVEGIIES